MAKYTTGPGPNNEAETFSGMGGLPATASIKNRQPTTDNPIYPTSYQFKLLRTPSLQYFCTKVSLPGVSTGEIIQENYFADIKHPNSKVVFGDFTVSFIVDEDLLNWLEIYNWITQTVNIEDFNKYKSIQEQKSDATLLIMSNSMNPKFEVRLKDCFPTELGEMEFDSSVSDLDPITCTVTFAYTTYEITSIAGSKSVQQYIDSVRGD
jgi:hypothetical protein